MLKHTDNILKERTMSEFKSGDKVITTARDIANRIKALQDNL